jgi:glutamate--cysteine ligase
LELVSGWTAEEREEMRAAVPFQALEVRIKGRTLREVALDMLALARGGLRRRGLRDASGADESAYLAPLEAIAERGQPLAAARLQAYNTRWGGSVDPAFAECVLL